MPIPSTTSVAVAQGAAYQWTRQIGGSGSDVVLGMGIDRDGNTYVVGNTDSSDYPTLNAHQPMPGWSPIYLVDEQTGTVTKVRIPGVSVTPSVALGACDPVTIYAVAGTKLFRSVD